MPKNICHQNYQIDLFVGVEKAAPLMSTFSFRSLLMQVHETPMASEVCFRDP